MLLIVPLPVHIAVAVIGILCMGGISYIFYRFIFQPAMSKKNDLESPPPREGFKQTILIDDSNRIKKIGIGQTDSYIKTRMTGIKEDHLMLQIRKEPSMEEYSITAKPGGAVFFRPPHSKKMEQLKNPTSFESRELIGNSALFRLAAVVKNGRALQYLEFELSTDFMIDAGGKERMKFFLTLKQIFPSLNIKSRNKKGIYSFGRIQSDSEDL